MFVGVSSNEYWDPEMIWKLPMVAPVTEISASTKPVTFSDSPKREKLTFTGIGLALVTSVGVEFGHQSHVSFAIVVDGRDILGSERRRVNSSVV